MSKGHRGVLYKRRYANGVNVSLWTDVGNTSQGNKPTDCTGCVHWSDGTITGERSQKHDTQTLATATGSYFCKLHYSGERCV